VFQFESEPFSRPRSTALFVYYCVHMRTKTAIVAVVVLAASLGADPAKPPTDERVDPFSFMETFRASHYLEAAVQIQKLDADKRADRLRQIAADPKRGSEAFPLCRMLFEAKGKAEFRRPMIGGPLFVDGGQTRDWPLEPITLYQDVPILVSGGYILMGVAEKPRSYVEYCLEECRWRDVKYSVPDKAQIKKVIDEFIASSPKLADQADWFRQQAE
jgi:hypothetical protein